MIIVNHYLYLKKMEIIIYKEVNPKWDLSFETTINRGQHSKKFFEVLSSKLEIYYEDRSIYLSRRKFRSLKRVKW